MRQAAHQKAGRRPSPAGLYDQSGWCAVTAWEVRQVEPFEDENIPLYTVGQVAEMLSLKQAFLRRIDELQVVSPQRSAARPRRHTLVEIRVLYQVD